MKKVLLASAMIALMAGCSKNETDMLPLLNEIAFSNLNDRVGTRAANASADDYRVFAATASGSEWYIDDTMDGTRNTPAAGPYYWLQPVADIDFWGYAPAHAGVVEKVFPEVSLVYSVPAGADEDLTIADKVTAQSGTVMFTFRHVLSKITVSANLSEALATAGYSITTAPTATVSVGVSKGTIRPTDPNPEWSAVSDPASYSGTVSYMVLPQNAEGTIIGLNGIVISKGGQEIFSGSLSPNVIPAGIVAGDAFQKGKHYAVKIGITNVATDDNGDPVFGSEILFSASVADWDTAAGTDTPLEQN